MAFFKLYTNTYNCVFYQAILQCASLTHFDTNKIFNLMCILNITWDYTPSTGLHALKCTSYTLYILTNNKFDINTTKWLTTLPSQLSTLNIACKAKTNTGSNYLSVFKLNDYILVVLIRKPAALLCVYYMFPTWLKKWKLYDIQLQWDFSQIDVRIMIDIRETHCTKQ